MVTLSYEDPKNNMYGCPPCPKCKSVYRWPKQPNAEGKSLIQCDDCGHQEEYDRQSL